MASNITEQEYSGGLLPEPHFDEEATLLSARPVVPLQEIKDAERSGRRLSFGLAVVAAVMIGAFGATLIYRQRGQAPAVATVETAIPSSNEASSEVPTTAEAGGGASDAPAPVVSASANVGGVPARELSDNAATRSRKPVTPVAQSAGAVKSTETRRVVVDNLEEQRPARRAERLEARRLRQEAKREARGEIRSRRVRRSDDLLRIREIFEGPRRP
jgi:hypothetical protein